MNCAPLEKEVRSSWGTRMSVSLVVRSQVTRSPSFGNLKLIIFVDTKIK